MNRAEQLKALLAEDDSDVFLHYALALEFKKSKNTEEFESQLQQVLTLDNNYLAAYYQLGEFYGVQNRLDEAKKTLESGIGRAKKVSDWKMLKELEQLLLSLLDEDESEEDWDF